MFTNKHQDPLDPKIDALLASQPLQPSPDFTQSVIRRIQDHKNPVKFDLGVAPHKTPQRLPARRSSALWRVALPFGLPIAAGIALALWISRNQTDTPDPTLQQALSQNEIEEIFLLEESISALQGLSADSFIDEDIFLIVDPLFPAIES